MTHSEDCDQCMNQLNIGAGCGAGPGQYQSVTYPQLPHCCRCCWAQLMNIPPSLSLSDARSYSLSAPLLPSALPALGHASHFYLWRRVCSKRVQNVTREEIFVEILSNRLYSQSTPVTGLGVGVPPEQCRECDLMITLPGDCQLQFLAPALTQTRPR